MANNKKIYFTYREDEKGNIEFDKVFITEEGRTSKEDFDPEVHPKLFTEFFRENGVEGDDLIEEAKKKGIFASFNVDTVTREELDAFLGEEEDIELGEKPADEDSKDSTKPGENEPSENDHSLDDDDEYMDDSTPILVDPENDHSLDDDGDYAKEDEEKLKEDKKVGKRFVYGALGVAAIFGTLGIVHSCDQNEVDKAKEEASDDLYKNLTEEQRTFFEPTVELIKEFNQKTTKQGVFQLAEDKTVLHITEAEAVALNVIMNDYTADELYSIFGTLELDTTNLMDLARSAYSKLSTYYMNAKEVSGLSAIINDEASRAFFERHENAIIEFNNNNTTELSDKVIKNLYYDYVKDGSEAEYSKVDTGVAWFATTTATGFELANRNIEEFLRINNVSEAEIAKYGDAAAAVGMSLRDMTTSELLSGINEAYDLGILDEMDNKSLCASVTAETKERVEALRMKQQIATTIVTTNAKNDLAQELRNMGAASLANEVDATDVLTPELLERISSRNASANQLVETYNGKLSSLTSNEAKIMAVLEIAQEKFGLSSEIDLADLVNNRTKSLTKEQILDSDNIPVVDADDFNKLSPSEKDDYIKENGTVTGQTTTKTEIEIKEEDLTPSQKEEVEDQKAILKEIEGVRNKYIERGSSDAIDYTEEVGAYDYNKDIVNPYNNQKIDTNAMSLFNIVAHASAFGDGANEITSADKQIQESMNKLSKDELAELKSLLSDKAEKYLEQKDGSDWQEDFMDDSYEKGFEGQVDGSLNTARKLGVQLNASAKEAFDKAQAEANKKNEVETPSKPTITTPENIPNIDPNDPNLNPGHTQPDEQPFVVREIEEPLYYLSDDVWEAAYGNSTGTDALTKTK